MKTSRVALSLACLAMLASCGGGGNSSRGPVAGTPTPTPTTTPTPTPPATGACSLSARQDFVRSTIDEWYLFPTLVDTSVNQGSHSTVQSYIDALVAPARAQDRDRFFSYITSIAEENAFANSGASAGFGFRLSYDVGARRVFIAETFEGTPALAVNIDRGTELLGIGTTSNTIQTVNSLMASGGPAAVSNALGPLDPGVTRVLRVRDATGVEREVSVTKASFALDPVSDRYGAIVIQDGAKNVGYVNLRTFSIISATNDLRNAFASFRQQGITEYIIDFRYNGGGLLSVSEELGDLIGRNLVNQVFYELAFRSSKSQFNEIYRFESEPQAVAPTKIAFIGTGSTASASELVINGMQPFLGDNMALIGTNTFGKPVGQSAFDRSQCDDRLRIVTIQLENANGNADYYSGLASTINQTCRANDDLRFQLGDPRETMVSTALDFLAGRPCNPIAGGGASAQRVNDAGLLAPDLSERSASQHEVPGLY